MNRYFKHPTRPAWLVVTPGRTKARHFTRGTAGWRLSQRPAALAATWLATKSELVPSQIRKYV